METIKLSVAIITFNEEKNIARCINSVKEIADDIVVVDSYSTDNTKMMAIELGARVIEREFDGHIQYKNFAITQAKFPNVLSLDADECLSDELIVSIKKVKENWQHDGYYMNRLNNYCGKWIKHGNWYPDKKLRLWDSRKGKWGGENPHDKFELSEGKAGFLKGDLLHYTVTSIDAYKKQLEKFATIASYEMYKKGKKVSTPFIYLKTGFTFLKSYLIKLGFLDGYYGWLIAVQSAQYVFAKYIKLQQRHSQSCCD
ncbi:MAG: glycosyltransferase family 2 protein [Pseudomonadota bacterium]